MACDNNLPVFQTRVTLTRFSCDKKTVLNYIGQLLTFPLNKNPNYHIKSQCSTVSFGTLVQYFEFIFQAYLLKLEI